MDFHFKPTELALWTAACVVFGWLIKSHFSSGRELRKQGFRAAITSVRDQFSLVRDEFLVDAHAQSLPTIREECSKLRDAIARRRWDELNSTVTTYSGLTKNDIENRDLAGNGRPGTSPGPNYSLGRTRIQGLLTELIKLSE